MSPWSSVLPWRASARRRPLALALALVVVTVQVAAAAWIIGSLAGPAAARATSLPTVTGVTAAATGQRSASVTWQPVAVPQGGPAATYRVLAYPAAGGDPRVPGGTCAGSGGLVEGTTCDDSSIPDGTWTYRVSAVLGSWTGQAGDAGTTLTFPADPCSTPANPVVAENCLTGSPASEWDVDGAGDASVQGFTTDISADQGGTVTFKVDTTAAAFRIDVYRLGWYGGDGARKVATVPASATTATDQPQCLRNASGIADCGNWSVSAQWQVPADAASGVYLGRLVRTDTGGASHVPFVVRDDDGAADLLFQTSDTTWQAYNRYGGASLYQGDGPGTGGAADGRAYKVSYNRPLTTRAYAAEDALFNAEYPMLRWLERNGYDVSYISGVDAHRSGAELLEHEALLSVGHDEYWSGRQRAGYEAARGAGVDLAFLSGNEAFWRTRFEDSIDGTSTPHRTLVTYKETHAYPDNADPSGEWTGTWRDPRDADSVDLPENGLTGQIFMVNSGAAPLTVPAEDGLLRLWRNSPVATSAGADTLGDRVVGYEWDEDLDNGSRPAGQIRLSDTTVAGVERVDPRWYGSAFSVGDGRHTLTLHRDPHSGALVFGAGTIQWSWGLDSTHDEGSDAVVPAIQQATVNLFADMGAQPATLQAGLNAAAPSTDTTPPTSTITSPSAATVPAGSTVQVTGTAADTGGGRVGGVEVSTDGGATWHPAVGRTGWSYSFSTPRTVGASVVIRTRATDDSLNTETPAAGLTVTTAPRVCPTESPCSIFGTPTSAADVNDGSPLELGLRFRSTQAGQITGVRMYKPGTATATYTGRLYTNGGTLLAESAPTSLSGSGWQVLPLTAPVQVAADTTYVASYYSPSGQFAYTPDGPESLQAAVDNPPLRALAHGEDGPSGVFRYGTGGGFPTTVPNPAGANYWADVLFVGEPDTTAPTVSSTVPVAGATDVDVAASVTATFSEPVDATSVTGATFTLSPSAGGTPVAATVSASGRTATLTPAAPLEVSTEYTAVLTGGGSGVEDTSGNALAADHTWSFTTSPVATTAYTIFGDAPGGSAEGPDGGQSIELGVKFRASQAGHVSAIRFYKPYPEGDSFTGRLYTSSGTLLGEGAVTLPSNVTGWQQIPLAAAVALDPDTTYVASYFSPTGRYAYTSGGLVGGPVTNGPLTALQSGGPDGANGVFRYGGGFPVSSAATPANYWTDVVFRTGPLPPDTTPPAVTTRSPAPGATGVSQSPTVSVQLTEAVDPASVTAASFTLAGPSGGVAATRQVSGSSVTLAPTGELAPETTYTVTLKGGTGGISDLAGNALAGDVTWSFTTRAGAAPRPDPTQGPGGPVLVVDGTGPFGGYAAEILRAEGLNLFTTGGLGDVTATGLAPYTTVVLGETALTAAQVDTLTAWVQGGGDLVALRPDPQLASLLGLTAPTGTLSEGYLKVHTAGGPGEGIVAATMQFHGTADRYGVLPGTDVVATLYDDASTATANPAVTTRSVGAAGGSASAFTYDLARSVVLTRQGNPAWVNQNRDGQDGPHRSDDLFYGAMQGDVQPDYVDRSKIAIPQADEQQRLLVNVVTESSLDALPLPRFWYLPRGEKAAIVMTADEHGSGDVPARLGQELAASPADCSVVDWECIRSTVYLYPGYPSMTSAQAGGYESQGFEIALHTFTGCASYSRAEYADALSTQLADLALTYPSVAPSATNRNHCIAWTDYTTVPEELAKQGIHLDTNYYYWPPGWVDDTPGLFTGSGFAQRFATTGGDLVDVYQATTQMTDESGQSYPGTAIALMDRALGPEGYYGTFVANLHTDGTEAGTYHAQVVDAAKARGVPVITARQLLDWTDGRNASSFDGLAWSAATGELTFSVDVGAGARGLESMVPLTSRDGGQLQSLVGPGGPVTWQQRTVKGVEYAVAPAAQGAWTATYGAAALADTTAPTVTATLPADGATAVVPDTTVAATFSEPLAAETVSATTFGLETGGVPVSGAVTYDAGSGTATFTPDATLEPGTEYTARLTGGITDLAGNPLADTGWTFTTGAATAPVAPAPSDAGPGETGGAVAGDGTTGDGPVPGDGSEVDGSTVTGDGTVADLEEGAGAFVAEAGVPTGEVLEVQVRAGKTATPDGSWSDFAPVQHEEEPVPPPERYLQYRLLLTTGDPRTSPVLRSATVGGP